MNLHVGIKCYAGTQDGSLNMFESVWFKPATIPKATKEGDVEDAAPVPASTDNPTFDGFWDARRRPVEFLQSFA
jgi:hypothetical protein